jgi:translation initiation factor IF-2
MAKTKISKLAKDLNVALPTVFEFLRKKEISIEENPNTRVEDSVAELINNEFNDDRILKNRSEQATEDRLKNRGKNNNTQKNEPTEIKTASENMQKPKIVGKIDLDKKTEAPKAEQPKQQPAAADNNNNKPRQNDNNQAHDKQKSNNNNNAQHQQKKNEQRNNQPKQNVNNDKQKQHKADNHKPQQQNDAKPVVEKSDAPRSEESSFIETKTPKGPTLNIIGKIDLDALNQSTRPKKKSKEDRRNERRQQAAQNGQGGGDRKKRKRIGGNTKVDIEKAGAQAAQNNEGGKKGGDKNNNGGGNNRRNDKRPPKRPVHQEVNEEDVSKQVKETLARLTAKDKNLKKGAKWRKEKREANAEARAEAAAEARAESRVLKLTEFVTANDLAIMMDVPINNVIATCMNIGVMVSINQRLDAETINIVAEEFGFKTEYVSAEVADAINQEEDTEEDLLPRSPIVTVMGHVDHGKTSLLDYIRNANVIAGEAGGITQHIGAYNVKLEDGRHITFLDTPGHEAFTAMRARGAKVTDLCIIIVAADDNVMPQTVEAINHASAAGVPIVFAINKIDKPHANPDKIKEELAAMNYLVEEWGGKYQSQDISAKKGIGVKELMEKVLLEAEMLDLKANPNRNAVGSIIESSLDKGRGYVATVLVQNGTLRQGDIILAGNHYGKIKAMFNERNQRITEAGPATPALILGLNGAPTAGDTFNVLDSEQEAREIANKREQLQREQGLRTTKILTLDDIARRRAIGNFQELNIIVKGDVDGSIEALSDSLIKLSTEEIQVNVLHKAVGEISESDVTLAAASNAVIIGFQVRPSQAARRAAERDGVEIRLYSVIYQAIEEVKDAMSGMLAPEIKEEIIGTTEVMETYRISKVGTIAGGMVREGKMKRGCKVRLIRDGIVRYTGDLGSLKRFKDDVKEVASGYDCGLSIAGYNDIQVGDMIEAFEEVEVNRTL